MLPRFRRRGISRVIAEDSVATSANMRNIIDEDVPWPDWLSVGQRAGGWFGSCSGIVGEVDSAFPDTERLVCCGRCALKLPWLLAIRASLRGFLRRRVEVEELEEPLEGSLVR